MMKRFRTIYAFAAAAMLALTACSSDDAVEQAGGNEVEKEDLAQIRLRVSPASTKAANTRAWEDDWAGDDEMMNIWTVVIVDDASDKVVQVQSCRPSSPYAEIDDLTTLPVGTYRFYTFANFSAASIENLLNLGAGAVPVVGADDKDEIKTVSADSYTPQAGTTGGDMGTVKATSNPTTQDVGADNITLQINGNNFDPTAADNGLGEKGIPMSNVQTYTIANPGTYDLIAIRMLAKIELRFYNETAADIKLVSASITDITQNLNDNLKLLPNLTTSANANLMTYSHQDIQPNLGSPSADLFTHDQDLTVPANTPHTGTSYKSMTIYVNESAKPAVSSINAFGLFFLKLTIDKGTTDPAEERWALISNNSDNEWSYIARNDYRIIPIVLDDYKLVMIPYDFPAIGVYPASVKEEDGLYTINFHDYGHFHLVPTVKKISTNEFVSFTAEEPTTDSYGKYVTSSWGLMPATTTPAKTAWENSWGTWTDTDKATAGAGDFYRTGSESYITTTTDGDEVGGAPVWYDNTSAPQWGPDGGPYYEPFIFGYIADPPASWSGLSPFDRTDRKVYHEFNIYLYREGMSAPRLMTYRLLMKLDADQMSYARRRTSRAQH